MPERATIVVFGLSGVGKTMALDRFAAAHPEFLRVSAGELLRRATAASGEELRTSSSEAIRRHQTLVGQELEALRAKEGKTNVILDAHSLIDNDVELVEVPVEAIEALSPTRLIFLEANPSLLAERRERDSRERPSRSIEELTRQQSLAKSIAGQYAEILGVPFSVCVADADVNIEAVIADRW